MKIRFIPIAQVALIAILMLSIQLLLPSMNIHGILNLPIFIILFIFGVALIMIGGKEFLKKSTTVNPINPEKTTSLVTNGIYKYSRNPMYVGFSFFLLAWAALIGSYISLIGLPIFIYYITKYQIIPEEIVLEKKFGESFIKYKNKVRRWI